MTDLVRPTPRPSWRDRVTGLVGPGIARLVAVAGALVLASVGAWWLLRAPAPPVEASLPRAPRSSASNPLATGSATSEIAAAVLVVQAAGAVVHPGVYRLPPGARVGDLLAAAGGPSAGADLDAVSLAARLTDGQRVVVPVVGQVPAPGAAPASTVPEPVDLNHATPEELETLPGIGPAMARAIVAQRERHGPFQSVDDLLDVPGIGPAKLAGFRDLVRV